MALAVWQLSDIPNIIEMHYCTSIPAKDKIHLRNVSQWPFLQIILKTLQIILKTIHIHGNICYAGQNIVYMQSYALIPFLFDLTYKLFWSVLTCYSFRPKLCTDLEVFCSIHALYSHSFVTGYSPLFFVFTIMTVMSKVGFFLDTNKTL
jgi:hypothetical protein